jgi:asparagine N-glycosylation enzyme membrane subunit Stt3
MLQFALFLVIAGIPVLLFLRRIRALKLSWGYAVVLTVPITLALWFLILIIVDLGRV